MYVYIYIYVNIYIYIYLYWVMQGSGIGGPFQGSLQEPFGRKLEDLADDDFWHPPFH